MARKSMARESATSAPRGGKRAAAKAPAKSARTASSGASNGGSGRAVYLVLSDNNGAVTVASAHRSLATARKAGKANADNYNPAVHSGTPVERPAWEKGDDGNTWRLGFTSGSASVIRRVKLQD
jgi:hypothetical protein